MGATENVNAIASNFLRLVSVFAFVLGIMFVGGGTLRGAGDTRATLVVTFAGIWLVRVVFGYLLGIVLGLGLFGMWIAWFSDWFVRAVLIALRFRTGKWKTLQV